jgi:cell division protein FtsW
VNHKQGLFLSVAGAITGFGIVMVYSASITSWPSEFERVYLSRQLAALCCGVLIASLCAWAPAGFWRRAAPLLLVVTVALLLAVLLPGLGTRVNGARRWLRFGPLGFQPSELAKIALPLFLCRQLEQPGAFDSRWTALARLLGPAVIVAGLVAAEPDLGTAVFLITLAALVLFAARWPIKNFALAALLLLPVACSAAALRPYQVRRLTGFLATWSAAAHIPYQLDQSLVSLGAGGLLGAGLGKGWQKLSFLPEANTDFVFAVVGEELGFLGTMCLLALWGGLYLAGLSLMRGVRNDRFATLAAFTLLTQMVLQALANMAVVTALVPPKGIPLPLVSYGGSALVMSLTSLGIIASLTRSSRTSSRLQFAPVPSS